MHENFPYSISLSWKGASSDPSDDAVENQQLTALFPKGNQIPSFKALTLLRSSTFSIDVVYAHPEELQSQAKISTYTVIQFFFITFVPIMPHRYIHLVGKRSCILYNLHKHVIIRYYIIIFLFLCRLVRLKHLMVSVRS